MSLSVPDELTADNWRRAGRELLAKTLAELSYEQLLEPVGTRPGHYRLDLPGAVSYAFSADGGAFGHWRVDPTSITRTAAGTEEPADDPLQFLLDARTVLGISGDTAGHLARELTATLTADARLLGPDAVTAAELADLGYIDLEGHQTGHPWLVPNKGRMGFSASDAAHYAPEARREHRLPWIAVHHSLAEYRAVEGLSRDELLGGELDDDTRQRFTEELTGRGLTPQDYIWMPVHPWQWDEVVLPTFTPQIAAQRIVPLGEGPDRYRAQQSIRTFANLDRPEQHYVKLPLSILNTLVWRGLPTERTVAAPAVTSWMLGIAETDEFLRDDTRAVLLGEVASVTVQHPVLERIDDVPYQYRELLGTIWRQSLANKLDSGERARTLASLLHVDAHGRAFVTELVERSGLDAETWLQRLFGALLPALLHFLYRYGVVFSPHGENTIVVFDEHDVPARLAVKDFVDDVNISADPLPELADLPAEVDAALLREPPEFLRQFIQSGLFVGHFRYLAPLVADHLGVPQERFWTMVREEVLAYQKRFPELAERFAMFDLFTPEIERLCLNRNRLLLDAYRDRPERPHAAVHGHVPNPLHSP
ncbi:siderophore synthetase component [Halopolyspora algeriensis]|uniref:Siderophore synthetase component n=1 Tax=Halopolyspora algeriensis TaxID=1500506 RepID=A0A368VMY2_9ACTN|nr:IucA/IucC family siderophore biosynthesis protein [Halopolyspora algeriensis]RCW42888.1 siderophore synthetase component [Halopolyspora algeriensis]TQM56643.1 siderophore synthetase component [Halopolyspora algeriensis]